MKISEVSTRDLVPYQKNAKKHDKKQIENVAKSITKYGFVQPIVIDKNNVVVIGHCRLAAAKKLGLDSVPCVKAEDLTEAEIDELRIVDNKTNESAWDNDLLAEELENLDLSAFDFDFGSLVNIKDEEEKEREEAKLTLREQFIVNPTSILDSREYSWIRRKRAWNTLIKDDGSARGTSSLFSAMTKSAMRYGKMNPNSKHVNGSSILDATMSEVLVTWFSPNEEKGINVFDCFAGDTVFGYVASALGKKFTGIELREEQASFNQRRLHEDGYTDSRYFCDDARNLEKYIEPESQDLFFSCPPYFDLEVYSDKPNDASNQKTYEDFYKILDEAFTKACKCLKKNRFAVVCASDIRAKDGSYYPFCDDIKATFKRNGFMVYNEIVLLKSLASGILFARRQMDTTRKVRRSHEEILVFYDGDIEEIQYNYSSPFCDYRQPYPTYDNILVFYQGDQTEIKKDFSPVEKSQLIDKKIEEEGEDLKQGDVLG